jgi:hypothetical protein
VVNQHVLPYLAALMAGLTVGTLADSPTAAGFATLVFASAWASFDQRYNGR